jgi:hypothetical protein
MAQCQTSHAWRRDQSTLKTDLHVSIEVQMVYRWETASSFWELGFRQFSFDHTVRISHHLLLAIFRAPMLFTQAFVPSAFRLQVSVMIQECSSKFFPTESGIPGRVTRRTQCTLLRSNHRVVRLRGYGTRECAGDGSICLCGVEPVD